MWQVRHCLGTSVSITPTTKYPNYPFKFDRTSDLIYIWIYRDIHEKKYSGEIFSIFPRATKRYARLYTKPHAYFCEATQRDGLLGHVKVA